jgi:hypothetical protein
VHTRLTLCPLCSCDSSCDSALRSEFRLAIDSAASTAGCGQDEPHQSRGAKQRDAGAVQQDQTGTRMEGNVARSRTCTRTNLHRQSPGLAKRGCSDICRSDLSYARVSACALCRALESTSPLKHSSSPSFVSKCTNKDPPPTHPSPLSHSSSSAFSLGECTRTEWQTMMLLRSC